MRRSPQDRIYGILLRSNVANSTARKYLDGRYWCSVWSVSEEFYLMFTKWSTSHSMSRTAFELWLRSSKSWSYFAANHTSVKSAGLWSHATHGRLYLRVKTNIWLELFLLKYHLHKSVKYRLKDIDLGRFRQRVWPLEIEYSLLHLHPS